MNQSLKTYRRPQNAVVHLVGRTREQGLCLYRQTLNSISLHQVHQSDFLSLNCRSNQYIFLVVVGVSFMAFFKDKMWKNICFLTEINIKVCFSTPYFKVSLENRVCSGKLQFWCHITPHFKSVCHDSGLITAWQIFSIRHVVFEICLVSFRKRGVSLHAHTIAIFVNIRDSIVVSSFLLEFRRPVLQSQADRRIFEISWLREVVVIWEIFLREKIYHEK